MHRDVKPARRVCARDALGGEAERALAPFRV